MQLPDNNTGEIGLLDLYNGVKIQSVPHLIDRESGAPLKSLRLQMNGNDERPIRKMIEDPYYLGSGPPPEDEPCFTASFVDNPDRAWTQTTRPGQKLALEFNGSSRTYFKVWIVNLCLTLLTFGLFSAWAKVRKKRYLYAHTTLDRTPFQYLAKPVPILKGRLIAAAGFLIYYLSSHLFTSLLPWIFGGALIAAPWVITRSAAFKARYSAFRNMTFHFNAGYLDTLKILYAWGLIPVMAAGMILPWKGKPWIWSVFSLIFGIAFPFWLRSLKKFIIEHTQFGGRFGAFSATGGQFFSIYFRAGLITVGLFLPLGLFAGAIASDKDSIWLLTYFGPLWAYASYCVAYAFIRAHSFNLVWNHTQVGPLQFNASMKVWDLVTLYITNAFGIIVSVGLLIPWAVIRTLKYRIDHLEVLQEGLLVEFQDSKAGSVTALGAETLDFFDLDFSL